MIAAVTAAVALAAARPKTTYGYATVGGVRFICRQQVYRRNGLVAAIVATCVRDAGKPKAKAVGPPKA